MRLLVLAIPPLAAIGTIAAAGTENTVATDFFEICIKQSPVAQLIREAAEKRGFTTIGNDHLELAEGAVQEAISAILEPDPEYAAIKSGLPTVILTLLDAKLSDTPTSVCRVLAWTDDVDQAAETITQRLGQAPMLDFLNSGVRSRAWRTYVDGKPSDAVLTCHEQNSECAVISFTLGVPIN